MTTFGTIEQAIDDLRNGKIIIVADDEDRENEGDLVCAAELATPEMINFMIRKAGGWICLALTGERAANAGTGGVAGPLPSPDRTAGTGWVPPLGVAIASSW